MQNTLDKTYRRKIKTLFNNFFTNSNQTPTIVHKIRIQAITRKAIRDGKDFNSIANILMADSYFQEKEEIFGTKKANELAKNTIKKALSKEVYRP